MIKNFILETLKLNAGFNVESQFLYASINDLMQNKDKFASRIIDERVGDIEEAISRMVHELHAMKDKLQMLKAKE